MAPPNSWLLHLVRAVLAEMASPGAFIAEAAIKGNNGVTTAAWCGRPK